MADQTLVKYLNELRLLTLLRTHGSASRADIARRLSLTPATITRLVANLERQALVQEVQETLEDKVNREPGRPGVRVALNPDGAFFLGVEIGVGIIRLALIDLSASVVFSLEKRVSQKITPSAAVKIIADHLESLRQDARFYGRVRSVGVTVPGLVTSEGFVVHLPILGWKEVNLLALLSKAVDLPSFVENNGNAAAFGAVYTQPELPGNHAIFLKLGTGCGGAAIINGRLLRGARGTAGEMGHLRMTEHGHRCSCGQTGCLESWVNLGALARSYRGTEDLAAEELAMLPTAVVEAAKAGDVGAQEAMKRISHYLSLGIVSLVNIFNPTTVMLGGMMRPVLEYSLEAIRERVADGIISGISVPEVRLSQLGIFECAVGAATIAHHHAFDISNFEFTAQELAL